MKTKISQRFKQRIATWLLNDPSIILRNNNQSFIEEKYDVIQLTRIIEKKYIQNQFDDIFKGEINEHFISLNANPVAAPIKIASNTRSQVLLSS